MLLLFWRTLTFVLLAITLWFALAPQPPALPLGGETVRHTLAFLLLPIVAGLACRLLGLRVLWLVFALFGGLIEILQFEMDLGRQAQWSDWFVDLAALTAAVAFLWVARRIGKRGRNEAAQVERSENHRSIEVAEGRNAIGGGVLSPRDQLSETL